MLSTPVSLPPVRGLGLLDAVPASPPPSGAHPGSHSMVRLPSYKELAALSQREDPAASRGPADGPRSSLFTKGLIHLPPLKVPSKPLSGKDYLDLARNCPAPAPTEAAHAQTSASGDSQATEREKLNRAWSASTPTSMSPAHPHGSAYNSRPHAYPPSAHPQTQQASPSASRPYHPASTTSPLSAPSASSMPITIPGSAPAPPSSASSSSPSSISSASFPGASMQPPSASSAVLPLGPPGSAPNPASLKFSHTNAKAGGRTKKQALSCFFCRERKIACGRPEEGSEDGRCNQCARRKIDCTYPTVSHRGQHSRLKSAARKTLAHGHAVGIAELACVGELPPLRVQLGSSSSHSLSGPGSMPGISPSSMTPHGSSGSMAMGFPISIPMSMSGFTAHNNHNPAQSSMHGRMSNSASPVGSGSGSGAGSPNVDVEMGS